MPLPAADLPEPIAVLVLAWAEAAPAVRALVEATQAGAPTVDSILVMVPQADAPHHLSAEEYLPLALPEAEAKPLAIAVEKPPAPTEAAPPLAEMPPPAPATTTLLRAEALEEDAEPATDELLLPGLAIAATVPASVPVPPEPALTWSAVRVLRLGSYRLPQLAQLAGQPLPAPVWLGPTALPAAPYLGAVRPAPAGIRPARAPMPIEAVASPPAHRNTTLAMSRAASSTRPATPASAVSALPSGPAPADRRPPQTAALETDFRPQEAAELAQFELASPGAADVLAQPATSATPALADWPEALATLRQPATPPALAEPVELLELPATAEIPTAAPHAVLLPAATHYPAPDLNFQIIQYARFAVPVALAESPFAVIYAPAWPTWLAAQELRQRTGRPLVLHLAALAASVEESAETAAGWMAELQRQALHRADLVLVETPTLAARLHRELGLATGTVRVIAATDAAAIAQALHEARPRPVASPA
ncbi:hypothetical protein GKZ68_12395 [Hymenobacter sp. BRD128]|uniref:hypothetical protein n=1 Tax=Hymenobacter sp. BRD128 TaxID=2675878 RepID=UPI0015648EE3|nr:hypothetical protein [Hymenobacter sp. BRD128]QKG57345.1 hypothetical protein GKZ68_12395 [Hymenobacter sp. BRD128]